MYFKTDGNGKVIKDAEGNFQFEGYCVDLLKTMAKKIGFDYDIVLSSSYDKSGYEYGKILGFRNR